MEEKTPMTGQGAFRWNAGGWFGSQMGGTAWLLIGAATFARQAPWVAAVWLVCFVVGNVIGTWLWRRRDQIRPYPALQFLILVIGVGGLLALFSVETLRPDGFRLEGAQKKELRNGILFMVIGMPVAWTYFALLERRAKTRR
jgi:hypothetical protein